MTPPPAKALTAAWRARPVFLTSTFRDLHAERDWLRHKVFPELEERLRQRLGHLEVIDLRWGVETANVGEPILGYTSVGFCYWDLHPKHPPPNTLMPTSDHPQPRLTWAWRQREMRRVGGPDL